MLWPCPWLCTPLSRDGGSGISSTATCGGGLPLGRSPSHSAKCEAPRTRCCHRDAPAVTSFPASTSLSSSTALPVPQPHLSGRVRAARRLARPVFAGGWNGRKVSRTARPAVWRPPMERGACMPTLDRRPRPRFLRLSALLPLRSWAPWTLRVEPSAGGSIITAVSPARPQHGSLPCCPQHTGHISSMAPLPPGLRLRRNLDSVASHSICQLLFLHRGPCVVGDCRTWGQGRELGLG